MAAIKGAKYLKKMVIYDDARFPNKKLCSEKC
jgi:hypothetical protein